MATSDLYQTITDKFVSLIEDGGLDAWRKTWQSSSGIPINALTGTKYRGWNWLSLTLDAGPRPNQWATFLQVKRHGGRIRKGASSSPIVFFKVQVENDVRDSGTRADSQEQTSSNDTRKKSRLIRNSFNVFNVLDIEGIEFFAPSPYSGSAIGAVMACLSRLQEGGLSYQRIGDTAAFWPARDLITMPQGDFASENDFCAVLCHEMVHATKSRLDRKSKIEEMYADPDDRYAFEELVAELGASFICTHLGITGDYSNHASYLQSWLRILKADKHTLYRAVKFAQQAADWLLGTETAVSAGSDDDQGAEAA